MTPSPEKTDHIQVKDSEDWNVVLGDDRGLLDSEIDFLNTAGFFPMSLGPREYLTSQVITILHWMRDQGI